MNMATKTTTKALNINQIASVNRAENLDKLFVRAYRGSNQIGKMAVLASISAIVEGDPDFYNMEDFTDLFEDYSYGQLSHVEFRKKLTHLWATAVGFKCRQAWPYYAE